jgi:hypothetical protein
VLQVQRLPLVLLVAAAVAVALSVLMVLHTCQFTSFSFVM